MTYGSLNTPKRGCVNAVSETPMSIWFSVWRRVWQTTRSSLATGTQPARSGDVGARSSNSNANGGDGQDRLRRCRRKIQQLERLRGTKLVIEGQTVITLYRAGRKPSRTGGGKRRRRA